VSGVVVGLHGGVEAGVDGVVSKLGIGFWFI